MTFPSKPSGVDPGKLLRVSAEDSEQLGAAAALETSKLPMPRDFSLEMMRGWIAEDEAAMASLSR